MASNKPEKARLIPSQMQAQCLLCVVMLLKAAKTRGMSKQIWVPVQISFVGKADIHPNREDGHLKTVSKMRHIRSIFSQIVLII